MHIAHSGAAGTGQKTGPEAENVELFAGYLRYRNRQGEMTGSISRPSTGSKTNPSTMPVTGPGNNSGTRSTTMPATGPETRPGTGPVREGGF